MPARRKPQQPSGEGDFLASLNAAQRRAVLHGEGPLLIIAGAGTGKTKVITHRIAHLVISKKARPEQILAVTFTEKAANEMEARVDVLIPYTYSFIEIGTFNSFGERILRDHALDAGLPPDFRLIDDVEQAVFFRENLFRFPLDYYRPLSYPTRHIQEILEAVRRLKQEDIRPDEYLEYARRLAASAAGGAEAETARQHLELARVYAEYEKLLREKGLIDFEDQVTLVVELFRSRPAVLEEVRRRFRYILVDEFQDTNYVQFELLKMLAAEHRNLTVVGDDDQSIFRFRGASLSNILNFKKVYPEARHIVLSRNYRSTQAVLDASYQLIRHNNPNRLEVTEGIDKRLKAVSRSRAKSIHLLSYDTISHEADAVAGLILDKRGRGAGWGEMAVLVRRNADADPFLRTFNLRGVPYRFTGSRGLYQQEEIRLLISFIKAVTDFEAGRELYYLALSPVYRADPYDMARLAGYAEKKHISLHDVFKALARGRSLEGVSDNLSSKTIETVGKIYEDLLGYVELAASRPAGTVVYEFLTKSGFLKELAANLSLESETKIKNIRLFFDKVKSFSELAADGSLQGFARYLDLLAEVGDNPATSEAELEEDAVNVMTVHKAKGLEFETVFLVSLVEDRFPGREQRERIPLPDALLKEELPGRENYLEEERRLFYVAMTRAKRELYMTWARDYGVKRLKKVSPFVLEALDIPRLEDEVRRASVLEEIRRYRAAEPRPPSAATALRPAVVSLSHSRVEDYLTCPLKYRFKHVLNIPVLPHHTQVFGRVLHKTIHAYLKSRLQGRPFGREELLKEYERNWVNEGYLSREHEELRKAAGREALAVFYEREQASGGLPAFLEKPFVWREKGVKLSGRFDRVDFESAGPVIIDYKTDGAASEKEADRKAARSLQLDIYALSFLKTQGQLPAEVRLYFLENAIVGRAVKGRVDLERAQSAIMEAAEGVKAELFPARPDWHNCNYCEYKTICPESYAY
jgi:DNA helicase-2/ATP-dependent DNA helicase PcrA